jgi:protein phosphatase 4 regulatory subunit 3
VDEVQEVCHLTAHPNFSNRAELMSLFMKEHILDVLARGLSSSHPRASSKAMEVVLMLIQSDVNVIRSTIVDPPHTMLSVLIDKLLGDDEHGLPEQALEALKYLLDPESMDFTTQRNAFLELFYNNFMERIVNVIAAAGRTLATSAPRAPGACGGGSGAPDAQLSTAASPNAGDAAATEGLPGMAPAPAAAAAPDDPAVPPPFVLALVLDLMQYCVTHHHFRIKYFVLRHTIIHKVLKLLRSPKRWLAVGALRFFRTCVGLKDEFYTRCAAPAPPRTCMLALHTPAPTACMLSLHTPAPACMHAWDAQARHRVCAPLQVHHQERALP